MKNLLFVKKETLTIYKNLCYQAADQDDLKSGALLCEEWVESLQNH